MIIITTRANILCRLLTFVLFLLKIDFCLMLQYQKPASKSASNQQATSKQPATSNKQPATSKCLSTAAICNAK